MGFNRISVVENGIKQEGQQWGADHGLELDAFNAGQVSIRKGPASLLYGSDAMGGAIELVPLPLPADNRLFGEASLLGKSVNGTLGGSLMLGVKRCLVYLGKVFGTALWGLSYSDGYYCLPHPTYACLSPKA